MTHCIQTKVLSLIFFSTLFINHFSFGQCHKGDWHALKALYESTGGEKWNDQTGWEQVREDAPPLDCNLEKLYGVTVNEKGRVICLDLDGEPGCKATTEAKGNNLRGKLPPELANLTYLTQLYLANNYLEGKIPPEIGKLVGLKALDLSNNKLIGTIPEDIASLIKLEYLNLSSNELEEAIPDALGKLTELSYLNLSANQLTQAIPETFGGLSNLTDLDLSENQLEGAIPNAIGAIKNLTILNLGNNLLSGAIPASIGSSNATHIYLHENDLTGGLSGFFGNDSGIIEVNIGGNPGLSAVTPVDAATFNFNFVNNCHIDDWTALKALYDNTRENGSWSDETDWDQVNVAYDQNCDLGDMYGVDINTDGRVVNVNLINNNLNGTLPPELGSLLFLTELQLSQNSSLTGSIPEELESLDKLEKMTIYSCKLSGQIPDIFSFMTNLYHLSLRNNCLSGSIPNLSNCNNLTFLSLQENRKSAQSCPSSGSVGMEEVIPDYLGQLGSLVELKLFKNSLTGSIPATLGDLNYLDEFRIHDNQLSGCYDPNLINICGIEIFSGGTISEYDCFDEAGNEAGNCFDATWEDFCETGAGSCDVAPPCDPQPNLNRNIDLDRYINFLNPWSTVKGG